MSRVTVRELMTLPVFAGTRLFAGASGLDRVVSGVNVMEVPDIEAYLAPGDLLLTSAYAVRNRPQRLVDLLPTLAASGLSGLAITPLRYLGRLPDALAAEADRIGFPVLVLPDGTSFNRIIGSVLALVLADSGADPGDTEAIRERLTGVALAGGGLEEIARTLAGALDREILILDDHDQPLGHAAPPEGHRPVVADEDRRNVLDGTPWVFPITIAGRNRGRIVVDGDAEPTMVQRRLIRQSCFAAGMHIAQVLAGIELDRRLRTLFLEELVSGNGFDEPALRQRSRLFGWDLAGERVVLLAGGAAEFTDQAVHEATRVALPRGSVAWSRGHEVVALVPVAGTTRTSPKRVGERWRTALAETGADQVIVAAGSVADDLTQLTQSHASAQEALRIAVRTGIQVACFEDLDLERLLLAVPQPQLEEFVGRKLGELVRHDLDQGTDLCGTLEAYLGFGNAAEAARTLFIHYNTMKHRLARITELVDLDLHDPRVRLTLSLALQIRGLT